MVIGNFCLYEETYVRLLTVSFVDTVCFRNIFLLKMNWCAEIFRLLLPSYFYGFLWM